MVLEDCCGHSGWWVGHRVSTSCLGLWKWLLINGLYHHSYHALFVSLVLLSWNLCKSRRSILKHKLSHVLGSQPRGTRYVIARFSQGVGHGWCHCCRC